MELPALGELPSFEEGSDALALPEPALTEVELSGPQKAAIIIALLGPQYATPIIEKIGDEHLRTFIKAFESMKLIPQEALAHAIEDFTANLEITSNSLKAGPKEARVLVEELMDDNRVERLFGSAQIIEDQSNEDIDVWPRLNQYSSEEAASYFEKQRPQMVAIVLGQVSTDKAGEILGLFSEEFSRSVVNFMTVPAKVDQSTLSTIARVVETELLNVTKEGEDNPLQSVSEIFSILPGERRDNLMDFLSEKDEDIAEQIRKGIITFEDLPDRLPRNGVPVIFREMDQDVLVKALKFSQDMVPGTIEFLYSNISQRMAEQFREQVEDHAPVGQKDGEKAQASMMGMISRLDKDGIITLIKPDTTEE